MPGSSEIELSSELLERYDRQLRLEGWDQRKLIDSKVIIVGVGAIGCELAKDLTLMGVGKIVLVDNDVIELSNLNRQMLFTDSDIGKPKAEVAAEKLKAMNPWVKIESYYRDVREFDLEFFKDSSVIASCLDNWPTRRWLNSLAVELDKPLVDAAMDGMYANLQIVIPGKTACLECHGEELIPRDVQLAECTLRRRKPEDLLKDLRAEGIDLSLETVEKLFSHGIKTIFDIKYSQADIIEKLDDDLKEVVMDLQEKLKPKMPALQSIASTIAGIASTEIIKILHGRSLGEILNGLLVYDGFNSRFTVVELKRREDCFVCGDYVMEKGVEFKVRLRETVMELKKRIAERFGFPDPELLYRRWRLSDEKRVSELGIKSGDVIYVETSRRYMPLPLRIEVEQEVND